jgi:hypothetical protein
MKLRKPQTRVSDEMKNALTAAIQTYLQQSSSSTGYAQGGSSSSISASAIYA